MAHTNGFSAPVLTRTLVETPRWLFLVALIFAPWVYGCTPNWAIARLEQILSAVLLLWLAGCAHRRMKPLVHPGLLAGSALVLIYGWLMTLNAHFRVDANDIFLPVRALVPWLPGTVDRAASVRMMLRVTCLIGVICFVCDLSTRRVWRLRIWHTMAATGVMLVLFGLIQSAFAQPLFLWSEEDVRVPYFATYYYHGNAGSFINLVLPLIAGLAALNLRAPDAYAGRAIWFPGLFICIAGAFVNVSRSAQAITVLICLVLLVWELRAEKTSEMPARRRVRWAYGALIVGIIICLVAFTGWERPAQKWALLRTQLNAANKRYVSTQVCLRMLPQAGWHGFGPGTFALVFPHYTGTQAALIPGIWRFAHNDYLQAILEWGWFAAIAMSLLLFGAMIRLFLYCRRRRDFSFPDRVLVFGSGIALAGLALHAFIDFPLQIASLQLYACVCAGFGWSCGEWGGLRKKKL